MRAGADRGLLSSKRRFDCRALDEWGRKEIIGLADGYRESTQSWHELLLDLQLRGLTHAPNLAIGDGALGGWHALREAFGATKEQRSWFHKTGNVLNAMPREVGRPRPPRRPSTFSPQPTA